jgi:hypothetical protein
VLERLLEVSNFCMTMQLPTLLEKQARQGKVSRQGT